MEAMPTVRAREKESVVVFAATTTNFRVIRVADRTLHAGSLSGITGESNRERVQKEREIFSACRFLMHFTVLKVPRLKAWKLMRVIFLFTLL